MNARHGLAARSGMRRVTLHTATRLKVKGFRIPSKKGGLYVSVITFWMFQEFSGC